MNQYHKIQTVYFRDPETKFKKLLEGKFSKPELEFLANNRWQWTEKIDGTNIRIIWNGFTVRFGGKTDNAQIPTVLLKVLQDTFTAEKLGAQFGTGEIADVCLYGEGFGGKIQKGSSYCLRQDFILFDVKIGDLWLERSTVEEITDSLDILIVPVVGQGTLFEAVEFARTGYKSIIAESSDLIAEGLILKPQMELFNRRGERVISKIKFQDFAA